MSNKELLYIEDTLGHLEQVIEYFDNSNLDELDKDVCLFINKLRDSYKKMFNSFYKLLK